METILLICLSIVHAILAAAIVATMLVGVYKMFVKQQ
jgi:uncharacterized membrane protein YqhA